NFEPIRTSPMCIPRQSQRKRTHLSLRAHSLLSIYLLPEFSFYRHSLRRGSSFTFLTPGPHWDFTLKRKRREKDDDVISLNSLDLKEPSNKRVRPLARVTSLANLISPVRNGAVRRFGQTIQSFTLRGDSRSPASAQKSSSRSTAPTPSKRRSSVLWSEMLDVSMKESLTTKEIKRQEAIYEMSRGEQDLIEDLKLARKAYHDPMLKLSIMSEEELTQIFGDLDAYIPLHEDLLARIAEATKPGGTVEQIGHVLVNWLPGLNAYKGYCSNQLAAKVLLDQKKQDPRVQDFLQRCLESPFSRKLDLWSFLDIPRSRLVKYPLLLKEILRHTPKDHPDAQLLEEAILIIQGVLSDINLKKGESECQYYIDKLEYLDEKQKDPRIEASKVLLCHGELKNKSGHKLHIFLFQDILVLTRPVTRNERPSYQVYRQPIPVQELVLEDLQDGDVRMGGSFRGAFGNSDKGTDAGSQAASEPTWMGSWSLRILCLRQTSERGSPGRAAEDAKGARAQQTRSGFRKARDTAPFGGKRRETLV
uniref:Neuroepithelial cell transforming 1 n=1 Tax=Panthera tigris altaica TaxID=74533 RepID=A0A8C9K7D4_PANTA